MSWVVISSEMAACTSQTVAFSGHLSTHGHLIGLRKNLSKSRAVNLWHWCCGN